MRYIYSFLILLMFGFAQGQQETFSAQFRSLVNGEGVMYARVFSENGQAKLTNIDGFVEITYESGSLIYVKHMSFDSLEIDPDKFKGRNELVFYLQPKTYQLKVVSFSILGDRSLFDNKFVNNDLGKSDEEKVREKLNIIDMKKELIGLDRGAQGGMVLGSPITYLYDRFSKSGKEKAKYAMLMERDRRANIAKKEFDDLTVTTLTNYTDEELEKFKEFCSFHPTFIESVDALELYFEILRCRDEYIKKEI